MTGNRTSEISVGEDMFDSSLTSNERWLCSVFCRGVGGGLPSSDADDGTGDCSSGSSRHLSLNTFKPFALHS